MSGSKLALVDMPEWPRLLTEREAAAYVRMSITAFRDHIGNPWPAAIRFGRLKVYDRLALDRAVDGLSRQKPQSPPATLKGRPRNAGQDEAR